MANRRVTSTGKDWNRDITALCGLWGHTSKSMAIWEIESGTNVYFVRDANGRTAIVRVVNGSSGKYLRTDPNSSCSDNLDNLPDC